MKTRTILPSSKPASHPPRFVQPSLQRRLLPLAMVCVLLFANVKSSYGQVFYYFAGNPAVTTSWWTNTDGTGTNPGVLFGAGGSYYIAFGRLATFTSVPPPLAGGVSIFVQNASTLAITGTGGIQNGAVQVENGATVQIIDDPLPPNLTTTFTYASGPPGATLRYLGSLTRNAGTEFPSTIHNLIINKPGASLFASPGSINGFSAVQAGQLILNSAGAFNINGPHTVASGAISSIVGGGGAVSINGSTTVAVGATVAWNPTNTLTLNAPFVSSGIVDITVTGVGTLSATALAPITVNAGSLSLSNDALNIPLGGLVTVTGGAMSLAGSTPQYSLNAGATVSGGSLVLYKSAGNRTLNINGALNFSGGTIGYAPSGVQHSVNFNGAIATSGSAQFSTSNDTRFNIPPSAGAISGSFAFDPMTPLLYTLNVQRMGQTVRVVSPIAITGSSPSGLQVAAGGRLQVSSAMTLQTSTSTHDNYGTVLIDSNSSILVRDGVTFATQMGGQLTVQQRGRLILGEPSAGTATYNNNGTTTVEAGGTLLLRGSSAVASVMLTNFVNYVGATAALIYDNGAGITAAKTPTTQEFPSTMPGSVTVQNANGVTLSSMISPVIGGTYTAVSGELTIPANRSLTLNGPIVGSAALASSIAIAAGGTGTALNIGGSGSVSGYIDLDTDTAPFSSFSINRSGARFRTGAFAVRDILTLRSGVVEISSGAMTLGNGTAPGLQAGIIGGSDSSFVDGAIEAFLFHNASGGTQVFPVGDGNRYLPIRALETITMTAPAPSIIVEAFNTNSRGTATGFTSLSQTEYWSINALPSSVTSFRIETNLPSITPSTFWAFTSSMANGAYIRIPATTLGMQGSTVMGTQLTSRVLVGAPSTEFIGYFAIGNSLALPTITGFSPALLGPGTQVVITGTNLRNVTRVSFGGINATSFQSFTPPATAQNQSPEPYIIAVVPAITMNGTISVFAGGGVAVSSVPYQFAPPPVVTSFTPSLGSPLTPIRIVGNTFLGTTATVTIGGFAASSVTIVSPTEIIAYPSANPTTGTITVRTVGGAATSTELFTVVPSTVITEFVPRAGGNGTIITISGRNFPTSTTAQVRIGGVRALDFSIVSSTLAYAVVGLGATGSITMSSSLGTATSATVFAFVGPPSISGFTPDAAGAGRFVTIRGRNLLTVSSVRIAGVEVSEFSAANDSTLVATVPLLDRNNSTTGTIRIQNPAGNFTTTASFTFIPPPVITSFEPTRGTAGTVVVITGSNFTGVTNVTVSGVPMEFTVLSPTQIRAVVGPIRGSGAVAVSGTGGAVTSNSTFTNIVFPPTITRIDPVTGTVGTIVTITGTNLGEVTMVRVGDVAMPTFTRVGTTAITFALPIETQSGAVMVRSVGGEATSQEIIVFFGPPIVRSIVPPLASPGSTVTINGLNFVNVVDVRFGGVPVTSFVTVSETQIVAVVGNGATGTVRVQSLRGAGESPTTVQVLPFGQVDSLALVDIYNSTGGRTWRNAANWNTNTSIALWQGVTIESGRVVGLELPDNGLRGELPGSVFALTRLRALNLSGNGLTGAIPPTINNLRGLEEVRLAGNQLTGTLPDSLAALTNLRVLDVSANRLSGMIPQSFCAFRSLRELNLSQNAFSSVIPPCIPTENKELVSFNAGSNRFMGDIPRAFATLQALEEFRVNNNQLMGTLPAFGAASLLASQKPDGAGTVTATPKLRVVDASFNLLSGGLAAAGFGSISTLREINVRNNQLTGTLPADMLRGLRSLETLNLANNQLSGTIPQTIGEMRRLKTLNLTRNSFTGTLPFEMSLLDSIATMNLDSNGFEGAPPEELTRLRRLSTLTLSANRLTGLPRLSDIRRLTILSVGGNRLTFRDLEENTLIENFTYSPQDSVGESRTVVGVISLPLRLSLSSGGTTNRYQWFRRVVVGANLTEVAVSELQIDSVLTVENFSQSGVGQYFCRITNTQAPNLTLVSRLITVSSALPQAPTLAPEPVFPSNGAVNVSLAPRMEWTDVPSAGTYEVEVSVSPQVLTDGRFSTLVASTTASLTNARITLANNGIRYFWHVRARNAGGVGPWSSIFSFETVAAGQIVTLSSVDFGRVPVADTKRVRAAVANVSNQIIELMGVNIVVDSTIFVKSLDVAAGTPIAPGRDIQIDFFFTPKVTASTRGTVDILYRFPRTTQVLSTRLPNILIGNGTPLKVEAANFDTVRVGRATLTTALIINRSNPARSARMRSVRVTDDGGRVFSLDGSLPPTEIASGDTATVVFRAEPAIFGALRGRFRVEADIDTVDDGGINAFSRSPRSTDLVISAGVRTVFDSTGRGGRFDRLDSAAPGETVMLEVYIAGDSEMRRRLFAQPDIRSIYQGTFVANRDVVSVPDPSVYVRRNRSRDNLQQQVVIAPSFWDGRNASDSVSVLTRVKCVAVNGSVDTTRFEMPFFQWGGDAAFRNTPGLTRVFVEVPLKSAPNPLVARLKVSLCQAGGTRFVGQSTQTLLARSRPNPTSDVAEITYSVRENGFVNLALFDVTGKLVQTVVSSVHAPGEYVVLLDTKTLTSGTYFVTLTTPSELHRERLEVVK